MSEVRTLAGNHNGYDSNRSLLVLSLNQTSTLYLLDDSVLGLNVEIDDPTIANVNDTDQTKLLEKNKSLTGGQKKEGLRIDRLVVKGLKVGSTTLRTSGIGAGIKPITVRVVANADYRQAGDSGAMTPELREELQRLPLRQAVLRVAEDQMHSKIGKNGGGFGRYAQASYDWCGAFAHYCWSVACAAHGIANPFGDSNGTLLSAQKAISWALQSDGATILRYRGGDPYGNSFTTGKPLTKAELETQEYIEISPTNPVEPADIVIVRAGSANGWKHVAMVHSPPTPDQVTSIDGNQGNPCIAMRTRSMKEKVNANDYALIFLHVHAG